jgi:anaerobic selenocysteine-containing dehydrogenase
MNSNAKELLSVCPLDCPDTCSLKVSVVNNQVVKVRGSTVNPITRGSICKKVAKYYPDFVHGKDRLTTPLLRVGPKGAGQFEEVSWQQAIDKIHQQFSKIISTKGAKSILPLNYAGPHGKLAGGSMDCRFFSALGATDLNRSPLCGGVRSLAYRSMFGSAPGMPPEQVVYSDLIIIWGSNVTVSNLHLMRLINQARKDGAKLVVIDPRKTQIAQKADVYLQVKPGTDVLLAMKLIACLDKEGAIDKRRLEQGVKGAQVYLDHAKQYIDLDVQKKCNVHSDEFDELLAFCRSAKSIALSTGVGLERTRNGGAAIRAALAIPALIGSLGQKGHGVLGSYGSLFTSNNKYRQLEGVENDADLRVFNIVDVANHLLDRDCEQSIDAVFIYNHNPVATHPDQNKMRKALSQQDLFVVGCDVQMNDSMSYADVILPASTHFEHDDVYASYGHGYLQRAQPVISPVGDSLPNTEIFRRLAKRFGFDHSEFCQTDNELMAQAFEIDKNYGIDNAAQLETDTVLAMQTTDCCWLSDDVLNTRSGLIEFYSDQLQSDYNAPLPEYKEIECSGDYILISPASNDRINATFGASTKTKKELLEINPIDAQIEGVCDGETVFVFNDLGEVELTVSVTADVAAGVLCVVKGAWCASSSTGQTVNALISNLSKTDIADGAAYYDTFVKIKKVIS